MRCRHVIIGVEQGDELIVEFRGEVIAADAPDGVFSCLRIGNVHEILCVSAGINAELVGGHGLVAGKSYLIEIHRKFRI